MDVLWGVLIIMVVAVWVFTVADLLRRHLGRSRTAAWLLIVLILPLLGSGFYWVIRGQSTDSVPGTPGVDG